MLADIPDLLAEVRSQVQPGSAPQDGMPRVHGPKTPAPLSVGALDDSDDMYAALVEHAYTVAEVMALPYPPLPHVHSTRGPLGYPAHTTPGAAAAMARNACRFIDYHLDTIDTELAEDITADITRRYDYLRGRYPRIAQEEQMPARCPHCDCLAVYKKPPRCFGDPEVYTCRNCERTLQEPEVLHQCELREKELKRKCRTNG